EIEPTTVADSATAPTVDFGAEDPGRTPVLEVEPEPPADSAPPANESAAAVAGDIASQVIPRAPKDVRPPEIIERVTPEFPPRARRRRLEAVVTLGVRVDVDGQVVRTLVKSSTQRGVGFEAAAEAAARRFRFKPGTEDGEPAAMWTEIIFRFERPN
ncbi:MAG: TonB family protein, partial [Acidobacteriota bacterium]